MLVLSEIPFPKEQSDSAQTRILTRAQTSESNLLLVSPGEHCAGRQCAATAVVLVLAAITAQTAARTLEASALLDPFDLRSRLGDHERPPS